MKRNWNSNLEQTKGEIKENPFFTFTLLRYLEISAEKLLSVSRKDFLRWVRAWVSSRNKHSLKTNQSLDIQLKFLRNVWLEALVEISLSYLWFPLSHPKTSHHIVQSRLHCVWHFYQIQLNISRRLFLSISHRKIDGAEIPIWKWIWHSLVSINPQFKICLLLSLHRDVHVRAFPI